ncbi:5'/3'-nucleotidase SurE [Rhodococcus sp. JVH1]|uniref:5'/3'-nucleotidase SurE n=1 Tax=Rhodococcus sp. JVH1 TaxID=745408 RepID=UPI0002F5C175
MSESSGTPASLRILLTNDDGWNAPGIRAVYAALEGAGHDVTVVAPLKSQSGMGGRKLYYGTLAVTNPDLTQYPEYNGAKVWAVGPGEGNTAGSPSDSISFGLSNVFKDEKPDLVISGANFGQNTGRIINNSGTAGAAVEAAETGIPSIAISNECNADYDPKDETEPDFAGSAAYLVKLVDSLTSASPDGAVIPTGTALNVNYPKSPFKGTKIVSVDSVDPIPTSYSEVQPGVYDVGYSYVGHQDNGAVDTGALAQGYVALTPIDSDFGRDDEKQWLEPLVAQLN